MLRPLYNWVLRQAASPKAPWYLAVVSFAEASFFPIPPDVMLAPMVATRPDKAWRYAAICTLASVAGAALGWSIGYFLQDLGQQLLALFGHPNGLAEFRAVYDKVGAWVILLKGLTPIPFKLVTIASGLAQFNFPLFLALCAVTRGVRFFIEAALFRKFGPAILPVIERRLALFTVLFLVILVGGFLVLHYV